MKTVSRKITPANLIPGDQILDKNIQFTGTINSPRGRWDNGKLINKTLSTKLVSLENRLKMYSGRIFQLWCLCEKSKNIERDRESQEHPVNCIP